MTTIATRTKDDPSLLIIDTETTGLHPEKDHVMCELCLLNPNQKFTEANVGRWFFELTDQEIARGSPEAFKINNYFERIDAEQQKESWVSIKDRVRACQEILMWTDQSILCGDNVQFDANFLKHWIWAKQFEPNWNYHLLDLESMTIGILAGGAPFPWNSATVADAIGIPFPKDLDRHTAFGDAYWNLLRFRKILELREEYEHPKLRLVTN